MTDPPKPPLPAPMAQTGALREFLAAEVVGGIALMFGTAFALVWANSPWQASYQELWDSLLSITLGDWDLSLTLRDWVNEGLMSIFFLVVALEIKREFIQGELSDRRSAVLPIVAAIGGMVVPALVFTAVNAGGPGAEGWAIPMATDIAFALGVLALIAPALPPSVRVFLLALAIVDDMGAIVVIAIFYSGALAPEWLAVAVAVLVLMYLLRRFGLTFTPVFVGLGIVLWVALHDAGVHATLAGVAMGLLAPASPKLDRQVIDTHHDQLVDVSGPEAARQTSQLARYAVSRLEWLEHTLHPWTSLVVVPIFALANAGVAVTAASLGDAAASRVTIGVVLGLVLGKVLGIVGASWLACRTGLAQLPPHTGWREIIGVGALGGIGFTVSLFITELAFGTTAFATQAKLGTLAASVIAAGLAALVLRTGRSTPAEIG